MDPISVIVTALVAGASAAAKETAGTAIKDAYTGLKNLIKSRFGDQPAASAALEAHQSDPETWDKPLRKSLSETKSANDADLIAAAQSVLKLADPQGVAAGKYAISVSGNVQGLVQGDHAQVTMNFGDPDKDSD